MFHTYVHFPENLLKLSYSIYSRTGWLYWIWYIYIYIYIYTVYIYTVYIYNIHIQCMYIYIIYRASTARMTKLEMFSDVHVEWSVWGYQDIDNQLLLWVGPIWMVNQWISTVFLHPPCSNFIIHPDSSLVLGCIRVFRSSHEKYPGWSHS